MQFNSAISVVNILKVALSPDPTASLMLLTNEYLGAIVLSQIITVLDMYEFVSFNETGIRHTKYITE